MDLFTVVGVRPHYVKAGALAKLLAEAGHSCTFLDLGQHYDDNLRGALLRESGIAVVELFDARGVEDPVQRLGLSIAALARFLGPMRRTGTIVALGDADPALVTAVVGRRLGWRLVHLEAGVRRGQNEAEHWNSVVCDRLADLRFCYSQSEYQALEAEGLSANSFVVGDVLSSVQLTSVYPRDHGNGGGRCLVTIHRPQNCQKETLATVAGAVTEVCQEIVWLSHPRTARDLEQIAASNPRMRILPPQTHTDLLSLLSACGLVVTDSGGLTREAVTQGKPVVVVHETGMWSGLVESGRIARADPSRDSIRDAIAAARSADLVVNPFDVPDGRSEFIRVLTGRER